MQEQPKTTQTKPETPPLVLSVKDLSVTYIGRDGEQTEAVRDVSFDVPDKTECGEIIVFLGPSGCGKSTILKAIAGLIKPTKGECSVDGNLITNVGRDRGMVFQTYTSFAWLTVRKNVASFQIKFSKKSDWLNLRRAFRKTFRAE